MKTNLWKFVLFVYQKIDFSFLLLMINNLCLSFMKFQLNSLLKQQKEFILDSVEPFKSIPNIDPLLLEQIVIFEKKTIVEPSFMDIFPSYFTVINFYLFMFFIILCYIIYQLNFTNSSSDSSDLSDVSSAVSTVPDVDLNSFFANKFKSADLSSVSSVSSVSSRKHSLQVAKFLHSLKIVDPLAQRYILELLDPCPDECPDEHKKELTSNGRQTLFEDASQRSSSFSLNSTVRSSMPIFSQLHPPYLLRKKNPKKNPWGLKLI